MANPGGEGAVKAEQWDARAFRGTRRFRIDGRLGAGGMGIVFRAFDRERRIPVALKTLPNVDGASLLRFKREFRALADISHPNVVDLFELFHEDGHWFFTMELLAGVSFLDWVRTEGRSLGGAGRTEPSALAASFEGKAALFSTVDARTLIDDPLVASPPSTLPPRPERPTTPLAVDVPRLRAALLQLVQGVMAIHAAGKLHRDIKPTNVIVTPDGRVVLLDFGVVGELPPGAPGLAEERILGTPSHMAPEQAACRPVTAAADWYAVGVVLYEALTGELPFTGNVLEVVLSKCRHAPPPPSSFVSGVPQDLDALTMELLRIDPERRPAGGAILSRLSARPSAPPPRNGPKASESVFIGREEEIGALRLALARTRDGWPAVARVHGRSGAGKSELVRRALEGLRKEGAVVLSGRCYEREAVPFKGVDGVIDDLCQWLSRLPEGESADYLGQSAADVVRIFPVLRAALDEERSLHRSDVLDPREAQKQAFASLREVLARIAHRHALVLHIDDLQWADDDSADLLEALLAAPDAPPLLFVWAYRDEHASSGTVLDRIVGAVADAWRPIHVIDLPVALFDPSQSIALARALAAEGAVSLEEDALVAIARESGGSPFFVAQLVRWAGERQVVHRPASGGVVSDQARIDTVIQERVARLPPDARALMEVLAVAGGPSPVRVVLAAAGVERDGRAAVVALRAARLVEIRGVGDDEALETSHDRIRETVAFALPKAVACARHRRLAETLEASGGVDAEALLFHWLEAGDGVAARRYVLTAAENAKGALAFERAARLFRLALDLGAPAPRWVLLSELAEALAAASQTTDVAALYERAAAEAPDGQRRALLRLAAESFLKTGHEVKGLRLLRDVLSQADLAYPATAAGALVALVIERARLRLRGLSFEVRDGRHDPRALERLDVAFAAAAGLGMFDLRRGALYGAQYLRLALDAGEPVRLCRALAIEAATAATLGEGQRARTLELVSLADELSARAPDPHGLVLARLGKGLRAFFLGEWGPAVEALDEAHAVARARCRAVAWEMTTAGTGALNALILAGRVKEARARVRSVRRDAEERGDRYALMHSCYPAAACALMGGATDEAREVLRGVPDPSPGALTFGHWGILIGRNSLLRFGGDARGAVEHADRAWGAIFRSPLARVVVVRVATTFERGLVALAALDARVDELRQRAVAQRVARSLAREDAPYAAPMGRHIAAGLAAARGRKDEARAHLEEGLARFEAAGMAYLAACARHRLGELVGGDGGARHRDEASAFFAREGIAPAICLSVSAPGFGGRP